MSICCGWIGNNLALVLNAFCFEYRYQLKDHRCVALSTSYFLQFLSTTSSFQKPFLRDGDHSHGSHFLFFFFLIKSLLCFLSQRFLFLLRILSENFLFFLRFLWRFLCFLLLLDLNLFQIWMLDLKFFLDLGHILTGFILTTRV